MGNVIVFMLGVAVGGAGVYYYERPELAKSHAVSAAHTAASAMAQGGQALDKAASQQGK